MALITINDACFKYAPDEPYVLKDFSLEINQGEFVCLYGDNGSGKSTLLRIINALSFVQSGSYTFNGIKITRAYIKNSQNQKAFHKEIGHLFQNPDTMLFNGRVYDEVAFGPVQMGLSEDEIKRRTVDCLKLLDIEDLSDKAPYHLSGGQKKRVAMASIMSLNPSVYTLDEPFAGLDKKSCDMMLGILKKLKEAGKTIIAASHRNDLIEPLSDKIITL